jgi:hypothetical protein
MKDESQTMSIVRTERWLAWVMLPMLAAACSFLMFATYQMQTEHVWLKWAFLFLIFSIFAVFFNEFQEQNSTVLCEDGISQRKLFRRLFLRWEDTEIYHEGAFLFYFEDGVEKIQVNAVYFNMKILMMFLNRVAAQHPRHE